jgi:hypothetical protein
MPSLLKIVWAVTAGYPLEIMFCMGFFASFLFLVVSMLRERG